MRKFAFKRWSALLLVFAFVLTMTGSALAAELVILHTNDVHARLEPFKPWGAKEKIGGLVRLASVVEDIKGQYPNQVVLVDAGDAIHGTNIANVFGGASVVEVQNAMGYRISTLGNHEFNYGQEVLRTRMSEYNHPVLASNVIDTADNRPFSYTSAILTINGIKIGFLGLVAPETPIVTHPKNVEGLLFQDPIAKASEIVPRLRQRADIVVAVNHIGLELDKKLAEAVPGIDVIISGHSHDRLEQPIKVGNTIIASAGEHAKDLGYLKLDVQGKAVSLIEGKLIPITAQTPDNPQIQEIIAKWNARLKDKLEQVVGAAAVQLDGERANVRTRETNLGNLVTDAMRAYLGTDAAITNGGGIRASINTGEITMGEVYTVLPFDNTLLSLELTGAQLLECLEHGVAKYPESAGSFLQVSGITFRFDPSKPAGQRITEVRVGGTKLDPNAKYSVATNDFMAAGGDGYDVLKNAPRLVDTGEMLRDIVAAYIGGQTVAPQVEGRIVAE